MKMKTVVIAGYVRSPFTPSKKGQLITVRPDELLTQVIAALVQRTGVSPSSIEDVIVGCAFPEGEQGYNIGRMASLHAGFPQSVPGMTVNRFCGSSMQAAHIAAGAIQLGAGEAFICAGVESMSHVPMGGFNPSPHPDVLTAIPGAYMSMGETAENVARQWGISRTDQERFAVTSQQRAAAAREAGLFADEIVSIRDANLLVETDGCIRPSTNMEGLAALTPAFGPEGTVTAGTSSPLTDGAAAVLVCTEEYSKQNNLVPLARIRSIAVSGCAPEIMGIGPVEATRKALTRAGIDVAALDVVELNEAFASQAVACMRELKLSPDRVNIDGGAIALGHPMGATGARILGKAAMLLKRTGGQFALATQCIGVGQGIATVLEQA
jgi:acetyl-CoA acyltransferase